MIVCVVYVNLLSLAQWRLITYKIIHWELHNSVTPLLSLIPSFLQMYFSHFAGFINLS